jgi:hypothetical protein
MTLLRGLEAVLLAPFMALREPDRWAIATEAVRAAVQSRQVSFVARRTAWLQCVNLAHRLKRSQDADTAAIRALASSRPEATSPALTPLAAAGLVADWEKSHGWTLGGDCLLYVAGKLLSDFRIDIRLNVLNWWFLYMLRAFCPSARSLGLWTGTDSFIGQCA